jgi:hypothetical protein
MKISSRSGLHRRDFVQWIGRAALALPCLELFEHEARAQLGGARRSRYVVFVYTNDGMHPQAFFPAPGTGPTGSTTLSPLTPYKDKVLVLGTQFNGGSIVNGSGLAYNTGPAQHRANICITASQVKQPLNGNQFTAVNRGDGPSLDWVIADALQSGDGANRTPIPLLLLGMHPIGGDTPSDITYDTKGNPQTRISSAAGAMTALFPGSAPAMGPAGAPAGPGAADKLAAVTNYLNSRFSSLKPQLGSYDQKILEQHLTSLRAFESQQAALLGMSGAPPALAASCKPISVASVPVDSASTQSGKDTQFLSPFFMQTVATAFACNLTRVATISFGYPGGGGAGGLRMPWLSVPGAPNFTDAQHGVSHNGGNAMQVAKYAAMNQWTVSQMKVLMDQLAAVKTPSGTLLDDTTIYFFNRHGNGNGHTNWGLPNMILGGTGGYFKTGQALALPATSPTKVLISIANAMGVDLKSFGTGPYTDTMPLAGLT